MTDIDVRDAAEPSARTEDTTDDVEALRAEVEVLRSERDETVAKRSGRGRRIFVGLLVALGAVLTVFALMGTWVRDTVLDTDDWVAAVGPLPEDPRVAAAVSGFVADEVMKTIDAQAVIERELTDVLGQDDAQLVAGPISSGLRDFVAETTDEVISSPEFRTVWEDLNRLAHEQAVLVLRGDGDVVESNNGQVTLNLLPLVNSVIAEVSKDASSLFGTDVNIPEISADDLRVPDEARQELSSALGVELPDNFAQITIYDDDRLAEVQRGVRIADEALAVLAIVAAVFVIGAIALSKNRRRTLAQLGIGVLVTTAVVFVVGLVAEHDLINQIEEESTRDAVQAAVDIVLLRGLSRFLWTIAAVAAAVVIGAWLVGPGETATTVRNAFKGEGRVAAFVRAHRGGLQVGGGVIAFLALVAMGHVSWGRFFVVIVLLALYLIGVSAMSRPPEPVEATAATPVSSHEG